VASACISRFWVEYGNVACSATNCRIFPALSPRKSSASTPHPKHRPKWIRNIVFAGNHTNDTVTAAVSSINIQDGDNIVVAGNPSTTTERPPTGIASAGDDARPRIRNEIVVSRRPIRTMQASSLDNLNTHSPISYNANAASCKPASILIMPISRNGVQIKFAKVGNASDARRAIPIGYCPFLI